MGCGERDKVLELWGGSEKIYPEGSVGCGERDKVLELWGGSGRV